MENNPIFSIVLPFYKQNDHMQKTVMEFKEALDKAYFDYEILVVINGLGDVDNIEHGLENQDRIKIYYLSKGGWGRAVKYGLNKATGKFVCYTNSARTDAKDLVRVLSYAKVNDNSVVKATRIMRDMSFLRKLGSIIYNFEQRILLRAPVWDVNGTPKVIPKKVWESLSVESDGDIIDAELVALCFLRDVPIIEVPVFVNKRKSGKSTTNIKSGAVMYLDLFRLYMKLKKYGKE